MGISWARRKLPGDSLTPSSPPSLPQGAEALEAEWELLLECAGPHFDGHRLAEKLRATFDWPSLIAFADDHGTLGLTAARLIEHDGSFIPSQHRETLRHWRRNQALFTMNLSAEMFRLFDSFAASGVQALVIKGPVLSVRSYGDPGLRQYGDLDLIVRDNDILRCTELMMALGYEASVPVTAIHAKKIPGEYNFRHPLTKLLIEFHTELTFRYHPLPIPINALFRRHVREKFDAHEVPALSPEDELVLICIHGAKHFWERLIYVADVAAFVARQPLDWDRLSSVAEEVGAQRMLHVGLRLATDVLGADLPENIASVVLSDSAAERLARRIIRWLPAAGSAPPGILQRASFRLGMHGGGFSGLAYLFRLSFSPTEEDWVRGAESKRHWFLDALGRPFRLARKYGRDAKS